MRGRVHWIQHVPFEHLGQLEPLLRARGASFTCTRAHADDPYPDPDRYDTLVVMGGPMSVNDEAHLPWVRPEVDCIEAAIAAGRNVLGVCLGAQMITRALGAAVIDNGQREIGWFALEPFPGTREHPLARAICAPERVLHWHGEVAELPDGATALARSEACALQAYQWADHVLALQFHLEMTLDGARALIAGCPEDLESPTGFVQSVDEILKTDGRFERAHRALDALLDLFPNSNAAGGMR